jgi:translation initiation factor IF-3
VKFKPHIEAHDYHVKLNMLKRFLMRGDQAKVTMVYRGRELAHAELGRRILDRLGQDLQDIAKVERTPQLDGRFMTMVFGPDREKQKRAEQRAKQKTRATETSSSAKASGSTEAGAAGSTTTGASTTTE